MQRTDPIAPATTGIGDFGFLTGSWTIEHRRLRRRLVGETEWVTFYGTCEAWEMMGGAANADDNVLDDPNGPYRAATVRRFDPETRLWSIWWWDARFSRIEPPVQGRFENGVGTFLADDELDGRPIKVRFLWSQITPTSARWEQAFSPDAGATWETNWVMRFQRRP
jgi:hypothetical protein